MTDTAAPADSTTQQAQTGDNHLSLSGGLLLVGDTTMAAGHLYGAHQYSKIGDIKQRNGKYASAVTAMGWGLGGIAAFLFGNPPDAMRARIEARNLDRFLKAHDIDIPQSVRDTHPLMKPLGGIERIKEFCYTYPSEILNGVFAVFSLGLIQGGLRAFASKDANAKANRNSLWIGLAVITGALGGLFIKEDADAGKKAENAGPVSKAIAWFKEKPLRFSSGMYLVNNLFLARVAWDEYQIFKKDPARKNFMFSGATLASYVTANIMLSMSSRDAAKHANINGEQLQQIKNLAAEIVAAQPKHKRQRVFSEVMQYLETERGLNVSGSELHEQLANDVEQAGQRRIEQVAERGWRARQEQQREQQPEAEHGV